MAFSIVGIHQSKRVDFGPGAPHDPVRLTEEVSQEHPQTRARLIKTGGSQGHYTIKIACRKNISGFLHAGTGPSEGGDCGTTKNPTPKPFDHNRALSTLPSVGTSSWN